MIFDVAIGYTNASGRNVHEEFDWHTTGPYTPEHVATLALDWAIKVGFDVWEVSVH